MGDDSADRQPPSRSDETPHSMSTAFRKALGTICGVVGVAAAVAVFVAPFAKSGSRLIAITLICLAAICLGAALYSILTEWGPKSANVRQAAGAAALSLALGIGIGYIPFKGKPSWYNGYLSGQIDDVRIYDDALTSSQIAQLMAVTS